MLARSNPTVTPGRATLYRARPATKPLTQSPFHTPIVFSRDTPREKDIASLNEGRVGLYVVRNHLPADEARKSAAAILKLGATEYSNAPGVHKGGQGMALFEVKDAESHQRYLQQAVDAGNPMHAAMRHIDNGWRAGVAPLSLPKYPNMPYGLIRVFMPGTGCALPHEDKLERDLPEVDLNMHDYCGQLACNLYLQAPAIGGALPVWNMSLNTETYDAMRGRSYGIQWSLLPPPAVEYQPRTGDLVFFNSRLLHAVTAVGAGEAPRVTASCFICDGGADKPLRPWS